MQSSTAAFFRQFIVKVHSRCDLACDHCYVYQHADQSWASQPRMMSLDTAARIGERVAEHARRHALDSVRFVLHGGEPLLCPAGHLGQIISTLRTAVADVAAADFRVHTNGVRLDEKYLSLFVQENVLVGVSLDGDRAGNDLRRRYADGRTSHPQVLRALALLRRPEYRNSYAGILCTIDLANDPIRTYEALAAEEPPNIGLLLPHGTWDAPPDGLAARAAAGPAAGIP
ncbi:MAG: radical SAM protein, partial [Catenulispora sp.]|nr:radical SAM protein [Catenulispora sp.]